MQDSQLHDRAHTFGPKWPICLGPTLAQLGVVQGMVGYDAVTVFVATVVADSPFAMVFRQFLCLLQEQRRDGGLVKVEDGLASSILVVDTVAHKAPVLPLCIVFDVVAGDGIVNVVQEPAIIVSIVPYCVAHRGKKSVIQKIRLNLTSARPASLNGSFSVSTPELPPLHFWDLTKRPNSGLGSTSRGPRIALYALMNDIVTFIFGRGVSENEGEAADENERGDTGRCQPLL